MPATTAGRAVKTSPPSRRWLLLLPFLLTTLVVGCLGPRADVPRWSADLVIPGVLAPTDSQARLAATLAPVLYLHRDESFQLARVVAAVHPSRRVVAYYLLWSDDVHGAWVPFTVPTDEEVVWVGYDSTFAPTEVWTYWHGEILHASWPRQQVAIDVQWGKHGSLPRGVVATDLPLSRRLRFFYAATLFGIGDILLSDLNREGPLCFCHGFQRYLEFTRPILLAPRLDAIIATSNPAPALAAVFGVRYSRKPQWPWEKGGKGGKTKE